MMNLIRHSIDDTSTISEHDENLNFLLRRTLARVYKDLPSGNIGDCFSNFSTESSAETTEEGSELPNSKVCCQGVREHGFVACVCLELAALIFCCIMHYYEHAQAQSSMDTIRKGLFCMRVVSMLQ